MRSASFKGVVLSGHKEDAVEVPFDPADRLGLALESLRLGRRGYRVQATLNSHAFESAIVARSKRFWLLIPESVEQVAAVGTGDAVRITVRA